MYGNAYGLSQPLNLGMESNSYMHCMSTYDRYDSIPFPFISCTCDPEYEMLWCISQNVIYL